MVGDRSGVLAAVILLAVTAAPVAAAGAVGVVSAGGSTAAPALAAAGSFEDPLGGTGGIGGSLDADAPGGAAPAIVALQAGPEPDNTITRIVVAENGTATWELRIRTRLETDQQAEEYRAFQDRFRANRSRYVDDFRGSITGIVANAREVTGREMRADRFSASTSIQTVPRRWGIVTYEFRWTGFAAVVSDRLRVGDVFEGGLFIAEDDALEVVGPEGYGVESAEPEPDESGDGVVSWQGREDFADRRPSVVFAPAASGSGEDGSAGDGAGATPLPTTALLGGAALVVLIGGLAVAYRWRGGRGPGGSRLGDDGDGPSSAGDGAAGGGGAAADAGPTLADEDHVRRLLEEHDGRVRQTEIAERLDWSRSKTSRVLSRMEEAGAIEKLRLGRENVIALADDEGE